MQANQGSHLPRYILGSYLAVLFIDWLYVFLVQSQPNIIVNAWFYLFPLITFFYAAFGLIAALGLIYRKRQGFMLALTVILFGLLSTAISYILVYRLQHLLDQLFFAIVIINACQMLFMARHSALYKQE